MGKIDLNKKIYITSVIDMSKRGIVMVFHKGKKAQAALEFLMTYGWAILIVLITIGALAYFGVLNPTILLPEKCTFQAGLQCNNHILRMAVIPPPAAATDRNHSIFLEFENSMGKGIIIRQINISSPVVGCYIVPISDDVAYPPPDVRGETEVNDNFAGKPGWYLPQGKTRVIMIDQRMPSVGPAWKRCNLPGTSIGKTKVDVAIQWHFNDATATFTHTMNGEILANIESS